MLGYDDFCGGWVLHRLIDDRYSKQKGDFRGGASFLEDGENRLKYLETGKVRFDRGPIMQATRTYCWHFAPDRIAVTFEDGGPFHSFIAGGQVAGTDHPCGDDYYRVSYDFSKWPDWTATWIVTGPRKDYTSISHYAPSPGRRCASS